MLIYAHDGKLDTLRVINYGFLLEYRSDPGYC